MTLERPLASTVFTDNKPLYRIPSRTERDYLTVPRSPCSPKSSKEGDNRPHILDRSISGQTFLSGSSTTGYSKTAWASTNSVDYKSDKKSRRWNKQSPSSPTDQVKSRHHTPNPHAYRREQTSSHSPSRKQTDADRKKHSGHSNGHLVNGHSSVPSSPDRSNKWTPKKSSNGHKNGYLNGYLTVTSSPDSFSKQTPEKPPNGYQNGYKNGHVNGYATLPSTPDRSLKWTPKKSQNSSSQNGQLNGYSTLQHPVQRSVSSLSSTLTQFNSQYASDSPHRYSTLTLPADRSFRSSPEKTVISQRSTCSREVVLDFPSSMPKSNGRSSHSSAAKRSEKSKEQKGDYNGYSRSIQPAKSMPGLTEKSLKDTRARSSDSRPLKACALFYFFRRNKKSKDDRDRSPSPPARSDKKNTHRRNSHHSSTSVPRLDRHSSPHQERRPSLQSSAKTAHTPTSSTVVLTPVTPTNNTKVNTSASHSRSKSEGKGHHYISRSRSHSRSERKHRSGTPTSRTQSEDRLRLEDLPPHPSIYKKAAERAHSNPATTPCLRNSTNHRADSSNPRSGKESRTDISSLNNLKSAGVSSASGQNFKDSSADSENQGEKSGEGVSSSSFQNLKDSTADVHHQGGQQEIQQSNSRTDLEDPEPDAHDQNTNSSSEHSRRSRSQSLPSFSGEHYQPDADTRVISDPEDFEYKPTDMKGPLNLSLCGCGFLGMYHAGVATCLIQRGPAFLSKLSKIAGASAGALIASVLVTARDRIEETAEQIQSVREEMRRKPLGAFTPGYSYTRTLRTMLEDVLPEDAHEVAQGKLYVSLTNAETKKNELITDFNSRDELIEVLLASCFIPVYGGMKAPIVRGKKYLDGGLSDNMPKLEPGRTITVSPFDGKSDIGPKQGQELEKKAHFINVAKQEYQVSMGNIKKGAHAFFPPKRHVLQEYFEKGRYDASRFLIREGLYEINVQPMDKKQVLYESSV